MIRFQNIFIRILMATIFCLVLMPLPGQARLVIKAKIVSGTITMVKDNAVALDGSSDLYYPASSKIEMALKPGSVVTLRYYVDMGGDKPINKYFQYKAGKNALGNPPPPPIPKTKQ